MHFFGGVGPLSGGQNHLHSEICPHQAQMVQPPGISTSHMIAFARVVPIMIVYCNS
jgi:hypothetical protein